MNLGSEAYITSPEFNIYLLPIILINNTPFQFVELTENLVVWLIPTINSSPHVNNILEKVHSSLGSFNFYRRSLAIPLKKSLIL